MKIEELMKQPLVVDKNISLGEAAKIMSEKRIGSLIFMSGDKLKGIITERDLLKNFNKSSKLTDIMETNIITLAPEDDIQDALEVMRDNNIKRIPILKDKKLVGIITLTDIAVHVEELEGDFFLD